MRFNVGDRVVCLVDAPDGNRRITVGSKGVVCREFRTDHPYIGVRWDEAMPKGHSCDDTCEDGYGWFVEDDELEIDQEYDDGEEPFEFDEDAFSKLVFG